MSNKTAKYQEWYNFFEKESNGELSFPDIQSITKDLVERYGIDGLEKYKEDVINNLSELSKNHQKDKKTFDKFFDFIFETLEKIFWSFMRFKHKDISAKEYIAMRYNYRKKQLKRSYDKGYISETKYKNERTKYKEYLEKIIK